MKIKKEDLKRKYQKARDENEIIEDEVDEGFSQEEEVDETSSINNDNNGILTEEMVEQIQRKASGKHAKTPLMPEEYADLKVELERIGYELDIKKKYIKECKQQ